MKEFLAVTLIVFKVVFKTVLFPFAFVFLLILSKFKVSLVYNVYVHNVIKAFESNGDMSNYPVLTVIYYFTGLLNNETLLRVIRIFVSRTMTPLEIIQNTPSDNKHRIRIILMCREWVIKLGDLGFVNMIPDSANSVKLVQEISNLEIRQEF